MIPSHLAKLLTWRGLPVPYINCWGAETDEHQQYLGFDPVIGERAWFQVGQPGEGEPDFTRQSMARQRRCAVRGLCQVCARHITKGRYLFASGSISVQVIENVVGRGDTPHVGISEPWLCTRCVPYVLRSCPGIRRRVADNDLKLLRVHDSELLVATMWHDDHGPAIVAASWVKIVPLAFDEVALDEVPAR